MIDFNKKPSEDFLPSNSAEDPEATEPEIDQSKTLPVPPPNLRQRIQAAQRARVLRVEPDIELPASRSDPKK